MVDFNKNENAENRNQDGSNPESFDFADIPILGKTNKGKKDSFSFEKFDDELLSHSGETADPPPPPQFHAPATAELCRADLPAASNSSRMKIITLGLVGLLLFAGLVLALISFVLSSPAPAALPPIPVKPSAPVKTPEAPAPVKAPAQAPPVVEHKEPQTAPAPTQAVPAPPPPAPPVAPPVPEPAQPIEQKLPEQPPVPSALPAHQEKSAEPVKLLEERTKSLSAFKALFKEKDVTDDKIEGAADKLLKSSPEDCDTAMKILAAMRENSKNQLAVDFFGKYLEAHPESPAANYFYAESLDEVPGAIKYLEESLRLRSDLLPDVYLAIYRIHMQDRAWTKAIAICEDGLRAFPASSEIIEALLAARIYSGDYATVLRTYNEWLKSQKIPEADALLKLVVIAQELPDPSGSRKCLDFMENFPSLRDDLRYYSLRHKMLYGKVSSDDFDNYPRKAKELYFIYLLSSGRDNEAMLVPVASDDFPEFWKVFINWYTEDKSLANLAPRLIQKYSQTNKVYSMIASLWLGKIKIEEAREFLKSLPPGQDEALCSFLLAEYYKKQKLRAPANVMYQKALRNKPNLYTDLINYYMKK